MVINWQILNADCWCENDIMHTLQLTNFVVLLCVLLLKYIDIFIAQRCGDNSECRIKRARNTQIKTFSMNSNVSSRYYAKSRWFLLPISFSRFHFSPYWRETRISRLILHLLRGARRIKDAARSICKAGGAKEREREQHDRETRAGQSFGASKALSEDIKRDRGGNENYFGCKRVNTDTSDTAGFSVVSSSFQNKAQCPLHCIKIIREKVLNKQKFSLPNWLMRDQ